jgi:hypothetical protein
VWRAPHISKEAAGEGAWATPGAPQAAAWQLLTRTHNVGHSALTEHAVRAKVLLLLFLAAALAASMACVYVCVQLACLHVAPYNY